jgi:ATP-dependent Lon protease
MYLRKKDNKFRIFLKKKVQDYDYRVRLGVGEVIYEKVPEAVQVFDVNLMNYIMSENSSKNNLHQNHKRILSYLSNTFGYLELVQINENVIRYLDELIESFPNFSNVVEYYKQQLSLSLIVEKGFFAASPLLISGPPGIGKTVFCHELAKIIGAHFEVISMSGMTASFVLSGLSSGWSEGRPGKIAETLAKGQCASSLIVLDELDKVSHDARYNPSAPLHQLLEKETAKSFVDEALEISIDCSHIVWVATANDLNKISAPILSRFAVIEVNSPTPDQMINVIRSIYKNIRENHPWGDKFNPDLQESVTKKIKATGLEPRLIQRELITACGRSVLKARENNQQLVKYDIHPEDFVVSAEKKLLAQNTHTSENQYNFYMPILNVTSVADDQEDVVEYWSVKEVIYGNETQRTKHIVGRLISTKSCRVSLPIIEFDRKSMRIKTLDKRVYQLKGPPGMEKNTESVWEQWTISNAARDIVDVTHQFFSIH